MGMLGFFICYYNNIIEEMNRELARLCARLILTIHDVAKKSEINDDKILRNLALKKNFLI